MIEKEGNYQGAFAWGIRMLQHDCEVTWAKLSIKPQPLTAANCSLFLHREVKSVISQMQSSYHFCPFFNIPGVGPQLIKCWRAQTGQGWSHPSSFLIASSSTSFCLRPAILICDLQSLFQYRFLISGSLPSYFPWCLSTGHAIHKDDATSL